MRARFLFCALAVAAGFGIPVHGEIQGDITVDVAHALHPVDPRIFGQYIEHFGRVVQGGLWAELLRNRKFYPIDPDRSQVADPWRPEADRKDVDYAIDRSETLDGISSQRVSLFGKSDRWRGISQTGFAAIGGREYVAYAWVRARPGSRAVSFRLESPDGRLAAQAEVPLASGEFRQYTVHLTPDRDLRPAVFRIAFDSPGSNWVGAASLMPADNVDGIRKDTLELIRAMGPTIFRWPGGGYTDSYDWRKAIGPRDRRPPQDILPFGQPYGYDHGVDPNDFGTDEYLRLCKRLGAQPYISANFGTGTPEMAAQWVAYCNGPASSEWGARRAANGHPEPYGVKYWSVGNENWAAFENGYTTGEGYAARFIPIARAMRAADPSISITAVGWLDEPDRRVWNEPVLRAAGPDLDMLSLHHYFPGGFIPESLADNPLGLYYAIVAEPSIAEQWLREMIAMADRLGGAGKKILLPLDEWSEWDWPYHRPADTPARSAVNQFIDLLNRSGLEFNQTARDGIFDARILQTLMRLSDRVPIGIRTHMINSLGAIRTDSTRAFITAAGKTMQLYRNHSGPKLVGLEQHAPAFDVKAMGWHGMSYLDAAATFDARSRRLYLHLINLHASEPLRIHIRLDGGRAHGAGKAWQIAAPDFMSRNDFGVTNVEIRSTNIENVRNDFDYVLPAHSITTLEMSMAADGRSGDVK